ncbi:pseudouridylate synthase [Brumimicrobium salinarum]|uniref:tRNA pseudouridine synthase C n=1 Tax=Brumimicrobium salinarum TaxID=2058658 RepID=A0A2I0QZU2_9FLAO|nr:pseudouridine synthase [Brumimicrobium salinarum]PKR79815.1 pseudouridylate synthase [Brumimicrobium salinarum]
MDLPLEVIYEDDFLVVINKPAGLLVHRTKIAKDAKVFAMQKLRDQVGYEVTPIHRLDRKTSGVLLFAKQKDFVAPFQLMLQSIQTQKRYLAIVRGFFPEKIIVNHPLMKENGKIQEAITQFRLIQKVEIPLASGKFETSRYSLIEAFPQTGRMHQIRKHLNHLRHPIIGDRPHGCNKQNALFLKTFGLTQMLLHSTSISFAHPFYGSHIKISANLPNHFKEIHAALKFDYSLK